MECEQTEPAETTTAGEMTHFLSLSLIIHKIFKICEVESLITSLKSMLSGVTATLVFSCILQFFLSFYLRVKKSSIYVLVCMEYPRQTFGLPSNINGQLGLTVTSEL